MKSPTKSPQNHEKSNLQLIIIT